MMKMNMDMARGVVDEARPARAPTRHAPVVALAAICTGYFMTILDVTVVNVALPSIQTHLGAGLSGLQWIVDGYALVFASLLLTGGALGDRLGGKRVFLVGLVVFTLASALCGSAPNLAALQIARVVQGIGAALLVPTSLSLLRDAFPDESERARAIGIWGAIAGTAAGAGPIIGGLLVNTLGWRAVFLANLPVGILGIVLTLGSVPPGTRRQRNGLDLGAQITAMIVLGTLTFACIEGGAIGWRSPRILGAFAVAIATGIAFVAIERRGRSPMLPLELFGSRTFSAANAVGFAINFGFYGQLFILSLFFQHLRHLSPLATGLALLPESGVVAVASAISGRMAAKVGPRRPMLIGLATGSVGLLAMVIIDTATPYIGMCAMLAATGFGISFTMPAMTAAVIASAPGARSGIASAALNASRQVGGVLGVAMLGALVSGTDFIAGMHVALAVAGGVFLAGWLLTLRYIRSPDLAGWAPASG
jgi:MFS transporter, DHA2 family, methylenomycin A resistance protein